MGDLLEKFIRRNEWDILDTDQKLDKLFEVIDSLQYYLDYHIPTMTKRLIRIEHRIEVLEKAQNKLFNSMPYQTWM